MRSLVHAYIVYHSNNGSASGRFTMPEAEFELLRAFKGFENSSAHRVKIYEAAKVRSEVLRELKPRIRVKAGSQPC